VTSSAIDDLTDLDRRIIVALQHDGRASWRAIADIVGGSVATVTRRGQQLLAAGVMRIAVLPALGSSGPVDAFLVRINCAPGTQLQVAEQLVDRPDVRFVTLVTGGYDIIAELVVHGGAGRYPQLIQQLQSIEGVERWRSDLIMHVYKVSYDWGRQLFERTMRLPEPPARPLSMIDDAYCEPAHFDEADLQIVDAMREDGRLTFQSVADGLGMNESSVRRRFERLRQSGCIDILSLVPAPALGMGAETLLTVTVEPGQMDEVARELASYPSVRYLAATLDQNSLFCEVITPSPKDLYSFITKKLSTLEGVRGWTAAMELLFLKRGFVETPWWRSQVGLPPRRPAALAPTLPLSG
jgi:DNA-binding Lrp family transcriptional regulator